MIRGGGRELADALKLEGLLPENVKRVDLEMSADDLVVLKYEVFVDAEMMMRLSRALAAMAVSTRLVSSTVTTGTTG